MNYFVRISSQNRPANRLQQSILDHFDKYHSVLTGDPASIYHRLTGAVEQAHRSHRRCTKQTVHKNQGYQTKEIVAVYVDSLVCLSFHPVLRTVDLYPTYPALDGATDPATTAADATENLPRVEIYQSRESCEQTRFDYCYRLSTQVQELLRSGKIWRIYLNENATPIAELYGGRTIPAYL